jgi:hypothetical protein
LNRLSRTAAVVALIVGLAGVAQAQSSMNMEILRDKISADKKLVIASNLALTESQASAFWPIYDEFQGELQALNQRMARLIQAYANEYNAGSLSEESARNLLAESMAIDEADVALREKYAKRLEGVIPEVERARYIQMERKIRALVRYDLAASIPLAE